MQQVLIGGVYDLLHTTNTEYNVVAGYSSWQVAGDRHKVNGVISTSGKLGNLRVELNDTPGGGSKTYTFTLHRAVGIGAWANTALTCTVGSGATQANDMVNEVSVAAGDVICLECDPTDTPTARYAKWSMVFEGDTANESLLLSVGQTNSSVNQYYSLMGAREWSVEDEVRSVCPTSGTIKNLFVQLDQDPGTAPDAYKVSLRIGGASQLLTVTITANDRTGNNVADDIAVSAGDILTILVEPLNTPSVTPYATFGMTFVADTDGESLILSSTSNTLDDTATEYNFLVGFAVTAWTVTEAQKYQLAQICVLKKLYMLLDGSPGGGKKYTFTVRRNDTSPASGLVVEIADAATTGNDTGNEVVISNDDELDLMVVPTGTPTVRSAYWGLVSYIAVGWTGKISGVTNPAKIMGVDVANIAKVKGVA